MRTTYLASQYITYAQGRLGDYSYDYDTLFRALEDVNREICNEAQWPFMETTFNGTVTIGEVYYDLQDTIEDFQVPISLQLTSPDGNAVPMKYVPYQKFDHDYPDPTALTRTVPSIWTIFGSTLIIGPAPVNAAYVFRLPYLKEPLSDLTDDHTINVPDAFREVVVLGMVIRAKYADQKFSQAQALTISEFVPKYDAMKKRLLTRQSGQPFQMGSGRDTTGLEWLQWHE